VHVAERVNAPPGVIAKFYDGASGERQMRRRERYARDLDIDSGDEDVNE